MCEIAKNPGFSSGKFKKLESNRNSFRRLNAYTLNYVLERGFRRL
jgi:hypothetical protein